MTMTSICLTPTNFVIREILFSLKKKKLQIFQGMGRKKNDGKSSSERKFCTGAPCAAWDWFRKVLILQKRHVQIHAGAAGLVLACLAILCVEPATMSLGRLPIVIKPVLTLIVNLSMRFSVHIEYRYVNSSHTQRVSCNLTIHPMLFSLPWTFFCLK